MRKRRDSNGGLNVAVVPTGDPLKNQPEEMDPLHQNRIVPRILARPRLVVESKRLLTQERMHTIGWRHHTMRQGLRQ